MKKGLLLRVALDKGSGGALAPIFNDGSFEYIPIPEDIPTSISSTYSSTIGRSKEPLSNFVPKKYADAPIHFDPEFDTFTYGDVRNKPGSKKLGQLLDLEKGDLLVFYAGLQPHSSDDFSRIYIIGYFEIEKVEYFNNLSINSYPELRLKFGNNAHFFRKTPDKELVVVIGSRKASKLLDKALPLGDCGKSKIAIKKKSFHSYTLPDLHSIGYQGSLQRAICHKITGEGLKKMADYLKEGVASLVDEDTTLRYYSMRADTGFAPNPRNGILTLACCKPHIRNKAKIGDWVIGTHSTNKKSPFHGDRSLCYLARISEKLTFDAYFNDIRFQTKKTEFHPQGDNIYYGLENKTFKQTPNPNHDEDDLAKDTKYDSVLISDLFWYFGKRGYCSDLINKSKKIKFGEKGRLEYIRDTEFIKNLVSEISSNCRIGMIDEPANYNF